MLKKILLFLFPKTIAQIRKEDDELRDIIYLYGSLEEYYEQQEYSAQLQQQEEEYYNSFYQECEDNYDYSEEEYDYPEEYSSSNDVEHVELQNTVPLREDYTKMIEGVHIHLHSKKGTFIVEKIFPNGFKICYNDKIFPFSDFKMYAGKYWQHAIKQD